MANNAAGGAGALLSGLTGGVMTGQQVQRGINTVSQNGLGLPGQSATGAVGLPQTQPQPAQPSTPDAKAAATQSTGVWGTIAGLFNQNA